MTWLAVFGVVAFVVSTITGSKDAGTAAAAVCLILAFLLPCEDSSAAEVNGRAIDSCCF